MRSNSLSATSAMGFEACPSRWVAETLNRAPQGPKPAADLGTACHSALEEWVVSGKVFDANATYDELGKMFYPYYRAAFSDDEMLHDGLMMLHRWYERTHPIKDREVLTAEVKENFTLYTNLNGNREEIVFNYVWDRADRIAPKEYEIIDYKTVRAPVRNAALRNNMQARCYGLAAQIKWPDAEKVWVTFDLLRFEQVGTVFTRDDNIATWRHLQSVFERMLLMDEANAPEKVNLNCRWCIRNAECETLRAHAEAGGVMGLTDPNEVANKRQVLINARAGVDAAINSLDAWLMAYCETEGVFEFSSDETDVVIDAKRTRKVDPKMVRRVIGDDLAAEYGSLGVTAVDKILKSGKLTPGQEAELRDLITHEFGEPKVKTTPRSAFEDD